MSPRYCGGVQEVMPDKSYGITSYTNHGGHVQTIMTHCTAFPDFKVPDAGTAIQFNVILRKNKQNKWREVASFVEILEHARSTVEGGEEVSSNSSPLSKECSGCATWKVRSEFSARQWRGASKKSGRELETVKRMCKACLGSSEQVEEDSFCCPANEEEESEVDSTCVVCMMRARTHTFLCGHRCFCQECGDLLRECPLCQYASSAVKLRIYL
jgi:hypothetical protein